MNIHFSFERAQKERRFLPHFSCTLRDSNEREIALESKKLRLQKADISELKIAGTPVHYII